MSEATAVATSETYVLLRVGGAAVSAAVHHESRIMAVGPRLGKVGLTIGERADKPPISSLWPLEPLHGACSHSVGARGPEPFQYCMEPAVECRSPARPHRPGAP